MSGTRLLFLLGTFLELAHALHPTGPESKLRAPAKPHETTSSDHPRNDVTAVVVELDASGDITPLENMGGRSSSLQEQSLLQQHALGEEDHFGRRTERGGLRAARVLRDGRGPLEERPTSSTSPAADKSTTAGGHTASDHAVRTAEQVVPTALARHLPAARRAAGGKEKERPKSSWSEDRHASKGRSHGEKSGDRHPHGAVRKSAKDFLSAVKKAFSKKKRERRRRLNRREDAADIFKGAGKGLSSSGNEEDASVFSDTGAGKGGVGKGGGAQGIAGDDRDEDGKGGKGGKGSSSAPATKGGRTSSTTKEDSLEAKFRESLADGNLWDLRATSRRSGPPSSSVNGENGEGGTTTAGAVWRGEGGHATPPSPEEEARQRAERAREDRDMDRLSDFSGDSSGVGVDHSRDAGDSSGAGGATGDHPRRGKRYDHEGRSSSTKKGGHEEDSGRGRKNATPKKQRDQDVSLSRTGGGAGGMIPLHPKAAVSKPSSQPTVPGHLEPDFRKESKGVPKGVAQQLKTAAGSEPIGGRGATPPASEPEPTAPGTLTSAGAVWHQQNKAPSSLEEQNRRVVRQGASVPSLTRSAEQTTSVLRHQQVETDNLHHRLNNNHLKKKFQLVEDASQQEGRDLLFPPADDFAHQTRSYSPPSDTPISLVEKHPDNFPDKGDAFDNFAVGARALREKLADSVADLYSSVHHAAVRFSGATNYEEDSSSLLEEGTSKRSSAAAGVSVGKKWMSFECEACSIEGEVEGAPKAYAKSLANQVEANQTTTIVGGVAP